MASAAPTLEELTRVPRIAYFSMEIALRSSIPTYSGGLGVLAGDTMRTAADLALPMVGVTLVSRRGYFRQRIDAQGRQLEEPEAWEPERFAQQQLPAKVSVRIDGRDVWVGGWLYLVESARGGSVPVLLLDTDMPSNDVVDRDITSSLYGGDAELRLKQEIVLGVGGVRLLQALGFAIEKFHMNEGHSALLAVELLRRSAYAPEDVRPGEPKYDAPRVRDRCIFTTHTPVEAGHDRHPWPLVARVLGQPVDDVVLRRLGGDDALNMTRLALNLSEYVNGVALRHAETSQALFPGFAVKAITNGVHPTTWTHPAFAALYDRFAPGWRYDASHLARMDALPDALIVEAHDVARSELRALVRERCGVTLDARALTLGFARRMTAYKRPALLFADLARLRAIAQRQPLQIVLAGKAHPRDTEGKQLIERLHRFAAELRPSVSVVFIPGYDMDTARALVAGVDVWLNTPERPLEASGTSGMKAALNGVPSLSVLDGWWVEGCIEGLTGWAIGGAGAAAGAAAAAANGDDARALYDKLEGGVLTAWSEPGAWLRLMRGAIAQNGAFFSSHRMMLRYVAEAYLR